MMLPLTSETTARGEASRDSFPVAHKQNELEQQVGLVSFITNLGRRQLLCTGLTARGTRGPLPDLTPVHSKMGSQRERPSKFHSEFKFQNWWWWGGS